MFRRSRVETRNGAGTRLNSYGTRNYCSPHSRRDDTVMSTDVGVPIGFASAQSVQRNLYNRPAMDSTSSKTTGWFRWKRWNFGPSGKHEGDNGRRGLSMKVGSKLKLSSNTEQRVDAEVAIATDNHKTVPDKILDLLVRSQQRKICSCYL